MNENYEDWAEAFKEYTAEVNSEDHTARVERMREMWEKYTGEDNVISIEELAALMENEPEPRKIKTRFKDLDKLVEGFRYEQLVVLSAQEKTGKTSFAIELVDSMPDEKACYFLFEQSAREIIRQRKERGQKLPTGYAPSKNIDNRWDWVEQRMFESMVKYGTRVFVIDNIDWLQKEYGFNQRTDQVVQDLLIKMKTFCKQWQVMIILIAHVKKMPMDQIPQPDDIKDASAFKQIADLVLILWRKTIEEKVEGTKTKALRRTNETLLWVAENRQTGKTGYTQLVFDGKSFAEKVWDGNMAATDTFNHEFDG